MEVNGIGNSKRLASGLVNLSVGAGDSGAGRLRGHPLQNDPFQRNYLNCVKSVQLALPNVRRITRKMIRKKWDTMWGMSQRAAKSSPAGRTYK